MEINALFNQALNYFTNPIGLAALALIIPFIIIYLIRPKPQDKPIPSLMFLLRDSKVSNQRSLFKTFMRNLLFLLQLLILLAIIFAISQPHIIIPGEQSSAHAIIVLDSSGSMKAAGRFDAAKAYAQSKLGAQNTLIVAEHAPFVLLSGGGRRETEQILSRLTAHDTQSDIGDAILLAGDYARKGSTIYVISDFASTGGADPLDAAQTLRARGIDVELHQVGSKEGNLGFTNLVLDKETTRAYVKNYFGEKKTVRVAYLDDDAKVSEQGKEIGPSSVEIFEFPTTQGKNRLVIDTVDALKSDDELHTIVPDLKKVKVLLISNIDPEKEPGVKSCEALATRLGDLKRQRKVAEQFSMVKLLAAFSSIGRITCDYTFPPILPSEEVLSSYDIIVLYKFSEREITPVSYRDLQSAARSGTHFIITSDRSVTGDDIAPLLPLSPGGTLNLNATIIYDRVAITKNVNFESVDVRRIISAQEKNGSEIIVRAGGYPIIARGAFGNGTILFYGLLEDYSDFNTLPDYVVFFGQLIGELTSSVDLKDYNFQTGTYLVDGDDKRLLEDAGVYTVGSREVAANLINDKESDTTLLPSVAQSDELKGQLQGQSGHPLELERFLIIAALVIITLEFLYTKMRGEI